MNVAEKELVFVKTLVRHSSQCVELFDSKEGEFFLCASTDKPEGILLFKTTPFLLSRFIKGSISLQVLFEESTFFFPEIGINSEMILYNYKNIEVTLSCGNQTIIEMNGN